MLSKNRNIIKMKKGKWVRFKLPDSMGYDYPLGLKKAGVYAILLDGKCVYIGQSKNIGIRLKQHPIRMASYSLSYFTGWGESSNVQIVVRQEKRSCERFMIEARMIKKLRPIGNKVRHSYI